MHSENSRKCLICKSPEYSVIFSYDKIDQYEKAMGVSEKRYFRKWVRCKQCGFYYSIYSRPKNTLERIYAIKYRDSNSSWRKDPSEKVFEKIVKLPLRKSETKLRIKWIKENINAVCKQGMLKLGPPPYNMLDIGGGTGIFAYEFQDHHWVSHVIDPDKDSSFIETKLNISYMQEYYKPNIFKHKFNLIALIYVLEHLLDPVCFLKTLHCDMAKNSFLFIEVPDAVCFQYRSSEDDLFNSTHLWMFDPINLELLLDSCGFKIFRLKQAKMIRGHDAIMVLAGQKPCK